MSNKAVILAGGTGSRLWPVSTNEHPKQFIPIINDKSVFENTYDLISKLYPTNDIYVNTFKRFKEHILEICPNMDPKNLMLEPFGRNTAPAIAFAEVLLRDKCEEDDIITFFPSDHIINNISIFQENIKQSIEAAKNLNAIISVGIKPTRPDNQLGYIQYSEDELSPEQIKNGIRKAEVFAEKPDTDTAERFIKSGDFVWNTGIFSVSSKVLRNQIKEHIPTLHSQMEKIYGIIDNDDFQNNVVFYYKQINSLSIDYGLLEKTNKLYTLIGNFSWSDLGTWDEFYRLTQKDENNNVIDGDVIALDSFDNLIKSDEKLITVAGINNLIIIESKDSIFVCQKGESEKVKDLINFIRANEINKIL